MFMSFEIRDWYMHARQQNCISSSLLRAIASTFLVVRPGSGVSKRGLLPQKNEANQKFNNEHRMKTAISTLPLHLAGLKTVTTLCACMVNLKGCGLHN